jgi:hypothetical protein
LCGTLKNPLREEVTLRGRDAVSQPWREHMRRTLCLSGYLGGWGGGLDSLHGRCVCAREIRDGLAGEHRRSPVRPSHRWPLAWIVAGRGQRHAGTLQRAGVVRALRDRSVRRQLRIRRSDERQSRKVQVKGARYPNLFHLRAGLREQTTAPPPASG